MKTGTDPRHLERVALVKALYTFSASGKVDETAGHIVSRLPTIDEKIGSVATERPLSQIAKIDLAILRVGVFELEEGLAPNIVIDEAVEIAKEYGSESSPRFINGVLGKLKDM